MLKVRVRKQRGAFELDAAFELSSPGVVAIYGASGCGKSTLIDIIAGLIKPDDGEVSLDGESLYSASHGVNVSAERRGIGYVFQDPRLFPHLNVRANLRYGASRTKRAPLIGFDEVVTLLALQHLLERRGYQLSGGERQRVALGRALLSQPRLLLLDEPLASLDAARREEVLPYLEALRDVPRLPMVYVSHQFDEVLRLATEVVLMRSGRIVGQGDLRAVSLNPDFRAMIGRDTVGAVVDGRVLGEDAPTGLTRVQVGQGQIKIARTNAPPGRQVRVQLLARDIIVATEMPRNLSVRNVLAGVITAIDADHPDADLVSIDIGGAVILARITPAATAELGLARNVRVWALIKAVSMRGWLLD